MVCNSFDLCRVGRESFSILGMFAVAFEYVITRGERCRGCFDLYLRRSSLGICLARSIWVLVLCGSYCRFSRWD